MFRLAVLSFVLAGVGAMNYEEAQAVILAEVASYKSSNNLCRDNTCCTVSASESCPISSMAKDQTTMVLPGGETRCIFSDSTPFAFQVIPGASDKLLLYLQGGGACWDEISTKIGFCTSDSSPQSQKGIFDRSRSDNHFKDHTVVHISYCSGDVFGGNVVRPYNDRKGVPVVQKGLANVQSAVDWVKAQQSSGKLAASFEELVIGGASAGSIGAQLWADNILSTLKWSKAAVLPDSYAGIFPEGTSGPLVYNYGFCTSGFLSQSLLTKCNAQTITMQDILLEFASNKPTVGYNFIQSKIDIVQQAFYVAIAITSNVTEKAINPTEFYNDLNTVFGEYNSKLPNFVTYLVDGDRHVFTNADLYWTADAKGKDDNGATNSGPVMSAWVNPLPLSNGGSINSNCEGNVQEHSVTKDPTSNKSRTVGRDDNTYCSSTVTPKTYTEKY